MVNESEIQARFGKPTAFYDVRQTSERYAAGFGTPVAIINGDGIIHSKGQLVAIERLVSRNCVTGSVSQRYSDISYMSVDEIRRIGDS